MGLAYQRALQVSLPHGLYLNPARIETTGVDLSGMDWEYEVITGPLTGYVFSNRTTGNNWVILEYATASTLGNVYQFKLSLANNYPANNISKIVLFPAINKNMLIRARVWQKDGLVKVELYEWPTNMLCVAFSTPCAFDLTTPATAKNFALVGQTAYDVRQTGFCVYSKMTIAGIVKWEFDWRNAFSLPSGFTLLGTAALSITNTATPNPEPEPEPEPVPDSGSTQITAEGDSITADGVWVAELKTLLPADTYTGFQVTAVAGDLTTQMLARISSDIALKDSSMQHIALIMGGVNDLGKSVTTSSIKVIAGNLFSWASQMRQAGFKPVIMGNTPTRVHSANPTRDYHIEATRKELYKELKGNYAQWGAMAFVDFSNDPLVGVWEAPLTQVNTYWSTDKLHPNDAGKKHIAALIKPIVEQVHLTVAPTYVAPGAAYEYINIDSPALETPYALEEVLFSNKNKVVRQGKTLHSVDEAAGWGTTAQTSKAMKAMEEQLVGYVEFVAPRANSQFILGFQDGYDTTNTYQDLYICLHANGAGVRFAGRFIGGLGDTTYPRIAFAAGDTLRLTAYRDKYVWYKNGEAMATVVTNIPVGTELFGKVFLLGREHGVHDVRIGGAQLISRAAATGVEPVPVYGGGPGSYAFEDVEWTGAVNATATGSTLTKNTGVAAGYNAGGWSTKRIGATQNQHIGAFEFTVINPTKQLIIGLESKKVAAVTGLTHEYAFRIWGDGTAQVYGLESAGTSKFAISAGSVLQIRLEQDKITWLKDGAIVFEKNIVASPVPELVVLVNLNSTDASISNTRLAGANLITL